MKSQEQKDFLWELYKRTNGVRQKVSSEAKKSAKQLGLKMEQVYKWLWNIKKKVKKNFLVLKANKNNKKFIKVDGCDWTGESFTPQRI